MNLEKLKQSHYYAELAETLVGIDQNGTSCDCCQESCSAGMKDRSYRLIQHLLVGSHQCKQRSREKHSRQTEKHAADRGGDHRRMDGFLHTVVILRPDIVRHAYANADRQAHKEIDDERVERAAGANRCQSILALYLRFPAPSSDHDGIGSVEQHLQDSRCH